MYLVLVDNIIACLMTSFFGNYNTQYNTKLYQTFPAACFSVVAGNNLTAASVVSDISGIVAVVAEHVSASALDAVVVVVAGTASVHVPIVASKYLAEHVYRQKIKHVICQGKCLKSRTISK